MHPNTKKFLIIQTAFIGDVILATPLIEKLHQFYHEAQIDFLLRKGNEDILKNHPYLKNIIIWDKKKNKIRNLWRLLKQIRNTNYDTIINLQRFLSTGVLTAFSAAGEKIGFDKNPMSLLFTKKVKHFLKNRDDNPHEVLRNLSLITHLTDSSFTLPKLYPSVEDFEYVNSYITSPYICIAPASVWFTKQFPINKWVSFLNIIDIKLNVFLLGSKDDSAIAEEMISIVNNAKVNIINLCGKLNLLQSAALMSSAEMNFVNDSAPLHLCSSVNAPTTAIFCSTLPSFGFGPLSEKSYVVQIEELLKCRPCNNHGKSQCPEKHFNCAQKIDINILAEILKKSLNFH